MNLRRGFFRLWLLFSALFVIATAVVFFSDVKSEFEKAASIAAFNKMAWGDSLLLPVECSADLRGRKGEDYEFLNGYGGKNTCWYKVEKFRGLYPEYKDLTDDQVLDRTYEKLGIPLTHPSPWTLVLKTLSIAVGVPLIVLAVGSAIGWSFAGFSSERLK
jgi:hypothetical protein